MDERTADELRAELATLRDDMATLRDTVRDQGAELARRRGNARRERAWRRMLPLLLAALLVALVPLATLAATPFVDLTDGPHDGNIDAIYAAQITRGCDPTHYCPTGNVTREEMASFLARTAGLGSNPPIANAKTAQTATSATSAGNANTVGGYAPSGLVRVARGYGSTNLASSNAVPIVTISITAPVAGFVLVTAGASAVPVGAGTACPCEGQLRLEEYLGASVPYSATINIATYADSAADEDSTALSYVFPVGAGQHTFRLTGNRIHGTATIGVNAQGSALFIPFGPTGGATIAP